MNAVLQGAQACGLGVHIGKRPRSELAEQEGICLDLVRQLDADHTTLTRQLTRLNQLFSHSSNPQKRCLTQQDAGDFATLLLRTLNISATRPFSKLTLDWQYKCRACQQPVLGSHEDSVMVLSTQGSNSIQEALNNYIDNITTSKNPSCGQIHVPHRVPTSQMIATVGTSLWVWAVSTKITTKITTSMTLTIPNSNDVNSFSIAFVIEHIGDSVHSGHYVCMVRTCTGHWWRYSDHMVTPISEQSVLQTQAYLVGYTKDTNLNHLQTRHEIRQLNEVNAG